jgi:nickel-dependent lactate racemase
MGENVTTELLEGHAVRYVVPSSLSPKSFVEAYTEAMSQPIGCVSLSEEKFKKPALIFADNTRKFSLFVPLLVNALSEKGYLKLICACGTHKSPSEEHFKAVLGEGLYEKFKSSLSISTTRADCGYESIGSTTRGTPVELNSELFDRDFIVSTLNVQPHYFAGFEGGCKALLPGCSSLKTILANHGRAIGNPRTRELMISGNDVREDVDEVSDLLERVKGIKHRILDFTLNPNGSVAKAVYGKPPEAHRVLAEDYAMKIWAVEAEPARLVISVADGPLGLNLYQALKAASFAADLTVTSLRPKSRVLLLASLRDGVGGEAFAYEMERYGRWEASETMNDLKRRAEAKDITEASQKPNRLALDDNRANFVIVSPNAPAEVELLLSKTKYRFYRSLDEAIRDSPQELLSNVAVIPQGAGTVPVPKQT